MAEIQIVYREGYCDFNLPDYNMQCHTCVASDMGCRYFYQEEAVSENGIKVIPFGDCNRAQFKYKYKGWFGKRYEIEECFDPYNPNLDSMIVTLGGKQYDAVKVILDGKCIFNEFDEQEKDGGNEQ